MRARIAGRVTLSPAFDAMVTFEELRGQSRESTEARRELTPIDTENGT